jgi:hypothetical protein
MGAQGAVAVDRDHQEWRVEAAPVDLVVDTNGAGDAFFAGTLHATLDGAELIEALRAGTRQAVRALEEIRRDHPISLHGVGLSIASGSTFDLDHVRQLAEWHRRYRFAWISEHLSAVRVQTEVTPDHHAGLALPLDLRGEDLLRAMRTTPASEYLVVDDEGKVYGVLATSDVEAALAPV